MKALRPIRSIYGAIAAATLFAGCAGTGGTIPQMQAPAAASAVTNHAKAAGAVAFVSDANNNVVDLIDAQGNVSTLSETGPQGIALDAARNLYVVDSAYSEVLVYAPPYNGAPKVLSNAGVRPVGVAVDANGDVAVTSTGSATSGAGGVVFYAKGATTPTNAIPANAKFAGDFYCAFDAAGNLYLDSRNGSGPFEAGEIVGGIAGKSVTPLTTKNLLQYPGGVQITKDGKIAILDQNTGGATVYAYDPPKHGSLGNPVKTTPLAQSNDAVAFALTDKGNHQIFTADTFYAVAGPVKPNHEDQIGQAQWFDYPSGGGALKTVRLAYNTTIVGAAVISPASP